MYLQNNDNQNATADFRKVLELSQDEDLRKQATDWLTSIGATP